MEDNKKKAVIFDLDGTLIDSIDDIVYTLNITAKEFSLKGVTRLEVLDAIGNGSKSLLKNTICSGVSEQEFNKIYPVFMDYYSNAPKPNTRLFDGVKEVLVELKKRGYLLAVLTNKPQPATDLVASLLLKDLGFDIIVGQTKQTKAKPDKESALPVLKALSVKPENSIMVGNMATDYLTAVNCGLQSILALWGYGKEAELRALGATVFAQNPLSLLDLIK